jgi:hypothetical protein
MGEQIKWQPTCDRFVAFLDIMGFKDRLQREGHEKIDVMLESLQPSLKDLRKRVNKAINHKDIEGKSESFIPCFPVSFSDSIIFFSSDKSLNSAIDLLVTVADFIATAIVEEIPIKGAIAYGKLTVNREKSIYFGKPIIDAFELQNEMKLYGAIFHHTAEQALIMAGAQRLLGFVYLQKYKVPLSNGKVTHHIINWTGFCNSMKSKIELVNDLYSSVSGTPRLYVDNTLEFVEWINKNSSR